MGDAVDGDAGGAGGADGATARPANGWRIPKAVPKAYSPAFADGVAGGTGGLSARFEVPKEGDVPEGVQYPAGGPKAPWMSAGDAPSGSVPLDGPLDAPDGTETKEPPAQVVELEPMRDGASFSGSVARLVVSRANGAARGGAAGEKERRRRVRFGVVMPAVSMNGRDVRNAKLEGACSWLDRVVWDDQAAPWGVGRPPPTPPDHRPQRRAGGADPWGLDRPLSLPAPSRHPPPASLRARGRSAASHSAPRYPRPATRHLPRTSHHPPRATPHASRLSPPATRQPTARHAPPFPQVLLKCDLAEAEQEEAELEEKRELALDPPLGARLVDAFNLSQVVLLTVYQQLSRWQLADSR